MRKKVLVILFLTVFVLSGQQKKYRPKRVITQYVYCERMFWIFLHPDRFTNEMKESADPVLVQQMALNLARAGGCEW